MKGNISRSPLNRRKSKKRELFQSKLDKANVTMNLVVKVVFSSIVVKTVKLFFKLRAGSQTKTNRTARFKLKT